ncbi:MAG: outer membrane protein assembly factor BamE [Alcanivorax sp.]|nr:outer membrane protein assembly factor BamE [Alcanivorax sp.]
MKTALAALLATLLLYPFPALANDQDGPTRGMSKAQVRQHYGEPESRRDPVGQPPISRWYYPGFTVYFENDTVLHSVREPAADDGHPGTTEVERQAGHPLPPDVEDEEAQIETRSTVRNEDADSDDDADERREERRRDDKDRPDESNTAPGSTAVRARAEESGQRRRDDTRPDAGETAEGDRDGENAGRFRFDPVSGRIVIDEDEEQDDNDRGTNQDDQEPRAEAPPVRRSLRADAD